MKFARRISRAWKENLNIPAKRRTSGSNLATPGPKPQPEAAACKRPRKQASKNSMHRVLFFPERSHRGNLSKLWREVRKAKKTLDVSVQYISHGKLRQALLEARGRGARVRVIVDSSGEGNLPSRAELERAGIHVRVDRTARTMHHKFAVVDKRVIVNGSLNWTNAVYVNMESVIISKSAALAAAFDEEFNHLWLAAASQVPVQIKRAKFTADGSDVLMFPDVGKNNLEWFLRELHTTTRRLDVCVFSLCLSEAVDAMCELQRRGITVRVISDKRHAANVGGRPARERLEMAGVEYLVDKLCGEMHHKFAVIDSETVICGSLNWSRTAVAGNTENMVIYKSQPSLAAKFEEEFELLRLKCRHAKRKKF